ncbi:MAG: hypothetical protein ACR2PX_13275 [Endozoicomonas sp.]
MRYSLMAGSVILSIVSIVFTVLLWSQLPEEEWLQYVSGLAGFALELCKFSLLPMAFLFLKNRNLLPGVLLLIVGVSLFVVSIGASVTFLETGEQARQQQSIAWQQRQTTISQLDEQIRIGQEAASRTLRADTLAEVKEWQKERRELLDKPVEQSVGLVGLESQKRFYAWLLLSILIDGCAVVGFTLLSSQENAGQQQKTRRKQYQEQLQERYQEQEQKSMPCVSGTVSETVTTRARTEKQLSETTTTVTLKSDLRERILSGQYGDRLTLRGVMEKEGIGYKKAKTLFDALEVDGVLVNTGKGYEVG